MLNIILVLCLINLISIYNINSTSSYIECTIGMYTISIGGNKNNQIMKRKVFKALAISRRWANTKRGETTIVAILTILSALFIIDD